MYNGGAHNHASQRLAPKKTVQINRRIHRYFCYVILLVTISVVTYYKAIYRPQATPVLDRSLTPLDRGLNSNTFLKQNSFCEHIERPKEKDIKLRNNFWQYFQQGNITFYLFGAYLDDREFIRSPSGRVVRLFPMMTVPIGQEDLIKNNKTYHLLFWYEKFLRPVHTSCVLMQAFAIPFWQIKNEQYGHVTLECNLPDHPSTPSHISLIYNKCDKPKMYIPLTVPEKPIPKPKTFAVCVKAIFGTWTKSNVTYIFSWLETLRAFGISHVHMYHDGLFLDDVSKLGFQYYTRLGFLTFEKLPNNLYETDDPYMTPAVSQSVVKTVINDCFYRNVHKYSFIAHIDIDEILIPHKHPTFTDLFRDYFSDNFADINTTHITSHSAYFYYGYPYGNPAAPDYIPVMQKTFRTPVEINSGKWYTWATRGTGVKKSIDNTKSCIVMSIHACAERAADFYENHKSVLLAPDLMLSHHYRQSCQMSDRCGYEEGRRINDMTIPERVGEKLRSNMENLLTEIGYFDTENSNINVSLAI